jgi:hypothetical protein
LAVVLCGSFGENARNQDRGREMKFETINGTLCRMVEHLLKAQEEANE